MTSQDKICYLCRKKPAIGYVCHKELELELEFSVSLLFCSEWCRSAIIDLTIEAGWQRENIIVTYIEKKAKVEDV